MYSIIAQAHIFISIVMTIIVELSLLHTLGFVHIFECATILGRTLPKADEHYVKFTSSLAMILAH